MTDVKVLEIRDRMTMIVAVAVRLRADRESRIGRMLWRSGLSTGSASVLLARADGSAAHCDPYDWRDARTLRAAHLELEQNWDAYANGALVDVRVVLGESATPCESEFL